MVPFFIMYCKDTYSFAHHEKKAAGFSWFFTPADSLTSPLAFLTSHFLLCQVCWLKVPKGDERTQCRNISPCTGDYDMLSPERATDV